MVNLRTERKRRDKAKDRAKAAENAARFGRSKITKAEEEDATARAARHLDQHRREDPET
ncbi:DUF4169 family protein [Defluviimonas aestuarii]|uniref:DUF4169 family protein n=1 Tax=Albidovulum aestuarii TaxID=1130726 RepID=UPI00249BDF7F|nr:DUF4169 family protein [Defluviimonas aestuarii]MDI3335119.1 DUF4169 family protein [Defluviimonas aestuarii]